MGLLVAESRGICNCEGSSQIPWVRNQKAEFLQTRTPRQAMRIQVGQRQAFRTGPDYAARSRGTGGSELRPGAVLGGEGDVTTSHVLWNHPTKHTDHIVSPLVSGGRMFLVKGGGINTVFDTKTGAPSRPPRRIGNPSDYYASPVAGDGKIYAAGESGVVLVLKDDAEYEVLAQNDMGESIVGTPAIADGKLFLRTRTKVMAIAAPERKAAR